MNSSDDSLYSSVEDLDPEPNPKESTLRARELIIGLVLVLGVLGWGGWQWWSQQSMQNAYRLAQEAAGRRDWDDALARFSALSGYKDADARRADAQRQITERNGQYVTAVALMKESDWPGTLQAVQAVERIQPGYLDIRDIGANAESQIYRQALPGAIAMRPAANPPGLYYREADGWTWLSGSDQDSVVRSFGIGGCAVYDVPLSGSSSTPTTNQFDAARGAHRGLMAFSAAGGESRFMPLAFDPSTYTSYVCTQRGIWAMRGRDGGVPGNVQSWFASSQMDYQRLPGTVTTSLVLPDPDWAVMDLSRDGERILLAQSGSTGGAPSGKLYLADPGGGNRRLLYSDGTQITEARFSPGGEYVLLIAEKPVDLGTIDRAVLLLDLSTNYPPKALATTRITLSEGIYSNITGTFVSKGLFAGCVVVAKSDRSGSLVRLIDPAIPYAVILSRSVGWGLAAPVALVEQNETSNLALAWQSGPTGAIPYRNGLRLLQISPYSDPASPLRQPLGRSGRLAEAAASGDYMLYSSRTSTSGGYSTEVFSLYSLPVSEIGRSDVRATQVYSTSQYVETFSFADRSPLTSSFMRPVYIGPDMLAYTERGRLHARTLDGKIDLPLETGVTGFYYNVDANRFDWLR